MMLSKLEAEIDECAAWIVRHSKTIEVLQEEIERIIHGKRKR